LSVQPVLHLFGALWSCSFRVELGQAINAVTELGFVFVFCLLSLSLSFVFCLLSFVFCFCLLFFLLSLSFLSSERF